MRSFLAILFIGSLSRADISPNYFCADMNPQQHINIEQLMGMWYGIEIITHSLEEQHYVRIEPSCPILHISEDKTYTSTYNPLYRDHDYRHKYGERRDYDQNTYYTTHNPRIHQYGRTSSPYNTNYITRRYGSNEHRRQHYEMKKLRIWWDENGSGTEYHLRYNITRPGFWFSSGPRNGSELEPIYSHFAGTIQVIKAVGNHLVLNFCHQLPDRQLFTILLSRENKLEHTDIHNVHTLLNRRGLSTSAIKKVCWNSAGRLINYFWGTLLLFVGLLVI